VSRTLTVLATGPQALVQDLGRPGFGHLGVPPSGALDSAALRLANRLAGNPESAAGIEVLLGGLALRANDSCTVVVTGPAVPVTAAGRPVGTHRPVHLAAGDELRLGSPDSGLRNYLAVGGGLAGPAELGSRATDTLSGLGPDPLRPQDLLELGPRTGPPSGADELGPRPVADRLRVPVLLGPREDWFDDPAGQLSGGAWRVSPESNRVGLRTVGSALRRTAAWDKVELASEAVLTGAVQVPPNGWPVIFLADHPTTGGYPVIGVVPSSALAALAQARPGTPLEFAPVR
jgi:biotin-dependent carboxylase-like uncharacterized protein